MKDTDEELLKEITILYSYYKELYLYAEELRTESFLPPINEVKDAFDHLMRVFSVEFELKTEDGNYQKINLEATFRHLYRAVFDLLDYIRIYQKENIIQKMKDFSRKAIFDVFPEYYREIVPEMEKCIKVIPIFKTNKDIGNPNIESVKEYTELVGKIRDYSLLIDEKIPGLIEYDTGLQDEDARRNLKYVFFSVISILIGYILGNYFGII